MSKHRRLASPNKKCAGQETILADPSKNDTAALVMHGELLL